jgi:hypothetical protein
MPECTFAELRDILLGLGFQMRGGAGSPVVFDHASASGRIIMESFADKDVVDPATLAVVRRNLDERGILSRARFDELLAKRSLAG